jgi:hypothetical protein
MGHAPRLRPRLRHPPNRLPLITTPTAVILTLNEVKGKDPCICRVPHPSSAWVGWRHKTGCPTLDAQRQGGVSRERATVFPNAATTRHVPIQPHRRHPTF